MALHGTPAERAALARRARKFDRIADESRVQLVADCFRHLARKLRDQIAESHIIEQRRHHGPRLYDLLQEVAGMDADTLGNPYA